MYDPIKSLIYSYLNLEEFLTLTTKQLSLRNRLVKLYKLPNINNQCSLGNIQTVKYLLALGIPLGYHALKCAAHDGRLQMVKYLIKYQSQLFNKWCLRTALSGATWNGHLDLVKYLKSQGADISVFDMNETIINGHTNLLKYLISNCNYHLPKDGTYQVESLKMAKYLASLGCYHLYSYKPSVKLFNFLQTLPNSTHRQNLLK